MSTTDNGHVNIHHERAAGAYADADKLAHNNQGAPAKIKSDAMVMHSNIAIAAEMSRVADALEALVGWISSITPGAKPDGG